MKLRPMWPLWRLVAYPMANDKTVHVTRQLCQVNHQLKMVARHDVEYFHDLCLESTRKAEL